MGFSAAGVAFGMAELAAWAFASVILASAGLLVIAGGHRAGLSSLSFIFAAFFIAYGLIATAGALAGTIVFLQPPYLTDKFLIHYGLACGGLVLGLSFLTQQGPNVAAISPFHGRALIVTAILFAGLATLFEAVNAFRAGGLELVLSGKAAYQSAVTSLRGTLPAEYAARIAVAAMALWMSGIQGVSRKLSNRNSIAFIVLISPILIVYLYHGRRTEILALLMILFVAALWNRPLQRLTFRLITALVLIYLGFAIILIARDTIFHPTDNAATLSRFMDSGLHALFPSRGEFGAPFAIFSQHVKQAGDAALLWGASYIDGFALVVPSFLYPGDKPVQLDTAFFATMYPDSRARPGGIAGYGYSPILEAFVNFGSLGVAVVYFVIGVILSFLERLRTQLSVFPIALFYVMILPLGQIFHRSTFGNAVLSPGLWIVLTVLLAAMAYYWTARRSAPELPRA